MNSEPTTEQLRISDVVRDVHAALVAADSRPALESAVCAALADSSPYVFAWIGTHDPETGRVVPRASGGVDEAYLDDLSISVSEPPTSRGPTATAVRTGRIQVMQESRTDPEYEPWRQEALDRGFESSVAVPLADDTDDYGVLNLYAERPAAFAPGEQQLLSELGETIATAITGIEARRELEREKEKFERLAARVSDGFYAVDSEWQVTYWNEQMAARTGASAAEVEGESLWAAFPTVVGTELEERYRAAMADGTSWSFEQRLDDPYDYWVGVDVYPDEDGLSVFSREITERKRRERELERFQRIIEGSTDVATIIDPDGTISYVSPSVERVLGYEPAALTGENGFDYQPPETSGAVAAAIEEVTENPGETRTVQTQFRRADGSWCWIESTLRNHLDDDIIDGILVSSRDITERRASERRLEEQRDSLEVLNQVLRHDIRNDLQLVTAYADLIADHLDEEGDAAGFLETVRQRAAHAVELTTTAGAMADVMLGETGDRERLGLRRTLRSQVERVQSSNPGAVLTVDGDIPSREVVADGMLESVFRNLLKNAVQHNDEDVPEVTVRAEDRGDSVRVRVADNGPGIPEGQRDSIFGKGEKGLDSEGTGLGLYLVRRLVERYGGEVRLGESDDGAAFVVELPTAD